MTRTLSVPIEITVEIHEIEGGGYWAEVPRLPGCLAQAETIEALEENLIRAVEDWWAGSPEKTEDEARRLAEIQGTTALNDGPYPHAYGYLPPASWTDEDE